MKNAINKPTTSYTSFGVAVIFALAGATSTVNAQPQTPSASASSYGSIGLYSGTYLYGPLNDSSTGVPATAQVSHLYSCSQGSLCGSSGSTAAYGSAHANAGGNAGAYSSIYAPNGSASDPYIDDTQSSVFGNSTASFSNSAVVQSALDPVTGAPVYANGTPVQISVSLLFDGYSNMGATDLQKASNPGAGGFTASSDVSASFYLTDPNITGTGETAGIPTDLISFQAGESSNDSSLYDYNKSLYVPEQSADTSWSLTSNHGDNLGNSTSTYCDGKVTTCFSYVSPPSGAAISGSALGTYFNTGIQTVTLDTTIGATLNWNASVDVLNQAYGATAWSESDYAHTFGVNLNPLSSNVTLDFSQAQVPLSTVPLPASLWLYLSGIGGLVLAARRKRKV